MHIEDQNNSFEEFEKPEITTKDRRKLLPWWIRFFCWVFMPLGVIAIATIPIGLFGFPTDLSIYGLSTTNSISLIGLGIIAVMTFKAYVAYLLFFGKDRAIELGKIDALIGILISIVTTVSQFIDNSPNFYIRIEIVFLILYFIKLNKIEYQWDNIEE
ncbi:MAG TPA: hypothetical protein VJL37_10980 [Flavobacterium sp.]|nr:hypothetical protein [Flavobacterium sp.]